MAKYNGFAIYPFVKDLSFKIIIWSSPLYYRRQFFWSVLSPKWNNRHGGLFMDDKSWTHIRFWYWDTHQARKRPEVLKGPIERLITMLKHCRNENLEVDLETIRLKAGLNKVNENCVVVNVAKKILIPLFGTAYFEKSYEMFLSKVHVFSVKHLGMGSAHMAWTDWIATKRLWYHLYWRGTCRWWVW